ncbi:MAG TPA: DNA mismatch repair endonuclease MutL [Clostridiales bacterium]|nr:DNA mismatch repair endonuclease MutL [Clostridiales bacterium]HQA05025.1 DNA mismatch repair endonuclease MutL [Clostridiales bacterium]HQD72658.1 DNA mismatch repair endonuclease MutL [Clostridiales bacterium]
MPKINVLPKSVAELIAAGEVVEKPASVVKELLENAIDSGADKITVEINSGGIKYIRVTDNGCGIDREDVRTAFLSHATSKIKESTDLNSIFTLGFRGEALASIAAVSRVNMLTRTADSPVGTAYVIEGGQEVSIDDAGCPVGTTIIVRDLFYNTPARMKFLKKDATEAGYVQDICLKIALSHPHISFRLIKDGKQVLFTPGDGKLISAIHSALGKEFADTLIPLSYSFEGLSAEGYISLPSFSRVNRNQQYFYINGRFVKIPVGASALDTAYKNSIMVGKFPACVINISIPPETVDVNVHPAKTEVRFSDEKRIFSLIFHAAQSSLAKFDAPSSVALSGDIAAKNKNAYKANFINESKAEEGEDLFSRAAKEKTETLAKMAEIEKRIEEKNPEDSLDKTLRLRTPTIALDYKGYNNPDEFLLKSNTKAKIDSNKENLRFEISEDITDEPLIDLTQKFESASKQVETKNENGPAPEKKAEIKDTPVIIGEAFNTYIIAEMKGKLLLIDKHAAHERMIYNKLKENLFGYSSQLLMSPVKIDLGPREYNAVIDNLELLKKAGFDVSDFGDGSVLVRSCPVDLLSADIRELFEEIADNLASSPNMISSEKIDKIYHSAACKSAIKSGKSISKYEMAEIVDRVLNDNNIRYCPHGRPVMIELTKNELEKLFGRIQ